MKYQLYGDGIHDDYPAIQEMLDSGMQVVYLPVPEKNNVTGTPIPFIGFMGDEGAIENLTLMDIDTNGDPLISHPERVKNLKQV